MTDDIAWGLTTWEGNRRRQHEEFMALSFREKLLVIEQMDAVAEYFAAQRRRGEGLGAATGPVAGRVREGGG